MTRYADPLRCPDCSAPIDYGARSCPACGLSLTGEVAQQLFVTLTRADELLASLRAAPVPAVVPAAAPVAAPAAAPVPEVERHRLGAASVPKILLGLGAACLLVAALVFLAYTWSVMSVAGRTATLVGFTLVAAGLAAWGARRGLRAAAEALSLVALGLLTLDAFGAKSSGWFGDISTAGFLILLGLLLVAAAAGGALAVRRTAVAALTGAELVAVIGTALVGTGVTGLDRVATSPGLVLAVLVSAAAAVAAWRVHLVAAAAGAALVAVSQWLLLLGTSVERAGSHPTVHALWVELEVWPLLASAVLAAAPALARRLPRPVRVSAAAIGYALLAVAMLAPVLDETGTEVVGAMVVVLAVTALVTWFAPRPWGLVGSLTQAVAGVGVAAVTVQMGVLAVGRLADAAVPPWSGTAGDRLPRWAEVGLPEPWLLPLCVLVLGGTVVVLRKAGPWFARVVGSLLDVRLGAVLALVTAVVTLALYPVPVWVPVALLTLAGLAFVAAWLRAQDPLLLGTALGALLAGAGVALHAEWLTAAALVAVLLGAGVVHLRARPLEVSAGAGVVLAVGVGAEVWSGGALVDGEWTTVALVALLVLGASCLLAPVAPPRWWAAPADAARGGFEAGAAAVALPVGAAGALLAPAGVTATWVAVYLTVAGVVVVAMSLLRRDRRLLGWPGGALLALASWVRLWDIGVHAPEAYTLPSAAALLVVGLVHLHRAPRATTMAPLSPGLALALVPSLLWALTDPASVRGLLLGIACFGLVVAGVRTRWAAPVLWGSTIGIVLVLRLAAPYIGEAVPRWVLIGAAGAVLIAMGVTWERRLADTRHVVSYVRSLR